MKLRRNDKDQFWMTLCHNVVKVTQKNKDSDSFEICEPNEYFEVEDIENE